MNILVRKKSVYEQVFYDNEEHYEVIAKKQLAALLEDFVVVDFKPFVLGDEGVRRKPDLALVDRRYRMWVVVEVELAHHSLRHHVLPQLRVLATGNYEDSHAEYMAAMDPSLKIDRLTQMVRYDPPKVMVLVNSKSVLEDGWSILESDYGVKLCFLETYRASSGDFIFNFSGYLPEIKRSRIAGAKKHKMMNALTCAKPQAIPYSKQGIIMFFDGKPVIWGVTKTADRAVLIPKSPVNLVDNRNYEILRSENGRLYLRQL